MEAKVFKEINEIQRWIPEYLKSFIEKCKKIYSEMDYIDRIGEGISIKEYADVWTLGSTVLDEYMAIISEYADDKSSKEMKSDMQSYFKNIFFDEQGGKMKLNWESNLFLERLYINAQKLKSLLVSFLEPRIIIPLAQTYTAMMSQDVLLGEFAMRTAYRSFHKFSEEENKKHLKQIFDKNEDEDLDFAGDETKKGTKKEK